jgi:hypothetical protein
LEGLERHCLRRRNRLLVRVGHGLPREHPVVDAQHLVALQRRSEIRVIVRDRLVQGHAVLRMQKVRQVVLIHRFVNKLELLYESVRGVDPVARVSREGRVGIVAAPNQMSRQEEEDEGDRPTMRGHGPLLPVIARIAAAEGKMERATRLELATLSLGS